MNNNLEGFLTRLSEALDVPEELQTKAIDRYQSVGRWLNREQSAVAAYEPEVYVQGSFRLGTAIRPIQSDEEYDIDLVCELTKLSKAHLTQKQLKQLVGGEVGAYAKAQGMNSKPEDNRRCWTLQYADAAQFHMDILPSIPDAQAMRLLFEARGHSADAFTDSAIAITDKNHPRYETRCDDWNQSNPRGYAEWFRSRMAVRFNEFRKTLAESMQASVEDVPEYKIKTPLQRAVQILKRHRDMMFAANDEHKPISVIISTLAAKSYDNEASLVDAFRKIVFGMETHIERRNGVVWVANPVNPLENFADKWEEEPAKELAFRQWISELKADYESLGQHSNLELIREDLEGRFGKTAISKALPSSGLMSRVINSALTMMSPLSAILAVSHRKDPEWPMAVARSARVTATYRDSHGRKLDYENNGRSIPVCAKIHFRAETNVEVPFEVHWQVVNTGAAAEKDKCLRGGFYHRTAGIGGLDFFEDTKYPGKHWVECFIVKGGRCVARSNPFFVNIS